MYSDAKDHTMAEPGPMTYLHGRHWLRLQTMSTNTE